ncbi:hypothetical protein [Neptuniibacter sp.]|uniref:hypothetical protein n=1 Tax=Neptuniibacter sp. TaxID=1962643 RepID=UPI00263644F4|nr:hypothetical protein [Neptuniibacter sp.]MCP4597394.1 hypothetical protein [Neptuniibacter sp.]
MKNLVMVFLLILSNPSMAEGISLFGKFITFKGGEFYNPYEVYDRDAISISFDRSCQQSSCYGKVMIFPSTNPEKIADAYTSFQVPKSIQSSCDSNFMLKEHAGTLVSVYKMDDYDYLVAFVGSKEKYYQFEQALCAD